ncbi:MAG: type VII secretion protein, partial [Gordonia amarae]
MFEIHRPQPRRMPQLSPTGAEIERPITIPPTEKGALMEKLMPLMMVLMVVGMVALMFIMGRSMVMRMIVMLPMLLMVLVMHSSMRNRGSGGSGGDIDEDREKYDLQLRETRAHIHEQGRAMHNLRTTCYPHPEDLTSMVGGNEMWQADPNPDIGRAVAPEDESDPDVEHLTSNPFLRARVGIGVAPLYPKITPAEDIVPEMLDPGTKVRYTEAMSTLSVVANLPIDVTFAEYRAYAMRGDEEPRMAFVRAMLMSLAFNHRPDHLNIGLITDSPQDWQWLKWLPHMEDVTKVEKGLGARLLTWRSIDEFAVHHAKQLQRMRSDDLDKPPHLLVLVDLPDQAVDWPLDMPGGLP